MLCGTHTRCAPRSLCLLALCATLACLAHAQDTPPAQPATAETQSPAGYGGLPGPAVSKRQQRQAQSIYLAGAKKLDRDDADAAQVDFAHAAQLDPGNATYPAAVTVARDRRITLLVRQAADARRSGDENKAQTLLAQARNIDPANPLVLEHLEPAMSATTQAGAAIKPSASTDSPLTQGWRIQAEAAGPTHLAPSPGTQSFDLAGDSYDVIRRVLEAYGIRAILDDTVVHKNLQFHMENVSYAQALNAISTMTGIFLVPVDTTLAIVANNDEGTHKRLDRQLQETIFLPGLPPSQFQETVQMLRVLFDGITLYQRQDTIIVRAPEATITALNRTIEGLSQPSGEVVIEVRLYEVDTSKMVNAGANVPTQFGLYNVDQAAAQLVSQNASLVQQAIAQGLISSTASNFEIAAALIGSGLVKSSLLNSTIGIFGGGIMRTGITETGSLGINLGLNSSDTRTLDDVQLRIADRQEATFREGSRYPVTSSTFSSGLTGAASSLAGLGNQTINGVPISQIVAQASQSANTIPQITYENLGITLTATPTIQKSGTINLNLDLKLEALTGNAVNNIPVLASRDFKSTLTVTEGQSALLSSMVSSSEVGAMSGLPGLSMLPGFQVPINDNVQKQTMQLVVVVTPHIVRSVPNQMAGPLIMLPLGSAGQ